jgi:hypothetical protein
LTESGSPDQPAADDQDLPAFDTSIATPARIWNYWLGGKDHFSADRAAAEKILEIMPSMPQLAQAARAFLVGAVNRLATEYSIRQFLDIGTGLPVANNTHEVAQRAAPESRIVYTDYDPVVLTHARALLTSTPQGKTDYIHADLRNTSKILAEAAKTLDLTQPVAILLIDVLHFIPDADHPYEITRQLLAAVPAGSYLVISHAASDIQPEAAAEIAERYNQRSSAQLTLRTRQQVTSFFDGLDLMEPGVVPTRQWPAASQNAADASVGVADYCGIALKG